MPVRPVRAASLVAASLLITLLALPAKAVASCAFDDPTATVTISMGQGDSAVVSRLVDAIALDGVACGAATVTNTDTIVVSSTGQPTELSIDLGGGAFAPGETAEGDADGEIEWQVTLPAATTLEILGTAAGDHIVIGAAGINLNATETTGDADITLAAVPAIVVELRDGSDTVSTAGGSGTGGSGPTATLLGGAAGDLFVAGAMGSSFDGGDGADAADYSMLPGPLVANLQAGSVDDGQATDTLASVEGITTTPGNDTIVGSAEANIVHAGPGSDEVTAAGGDDTIDLGDGDDRVNGDDGADDMTGGAGTDVVVFHGAGAKITVDLADGTATGDGADTIAGFENVVGSGRGDVIHGDDGPNVLDARAGADDVYGHDGGDDLSGERGSDLLYGQSGNDVLLGGLAKDLLDGGKGNDDVCRGGEDPDSFVLCENYRTSLTGVPFVEPS